MIKIRAGLPLLLATVLSQAGGENRAAASARYTLTDLGTQFAIGGGPGSINYLAPQIDDFGSVYAGTGQTEAGGYSYQPSIALAPFNGQFKPGTNVQESQYSQPGSSLMTIYPPGGSSSANSFTYAGGINASGTAVGWAEPVSPTAFVLRPTGAGQLPSLSVIPGAYPGTVAWDALGVNAAGLIVGQTPPPGAVVSAALSLGIGRAYVSDGTTTTDLNTLIAPGSGFLLTSATSINYLGQIVGIALDSNDGRGHAYLLTPTATPEPGAWAVALAAIGYLGLRGLGKADR